MARRLGPQALAADFEATGLRPVTCWRYSGSGLADTVQFC
jgi:hypothetical protein